MQVIIENLLQKILNENQKMFLIKKDFYDDWKQFHEDEFEWEDHKANDVKAIQDEINTFLQCSSSPTP